jgi:hypothetical protein
LNGEAIFCNNEVAMGDFLDIFFFKFALNAPIRYYDENALTQNPKK